MNNKKVYYKAIIFKGTKIDETIIASNFEQLKIKCIPFKYDDSVTFIQVSKIQDICVLKVPEGEIFDDSYREAKESDFYE